MTPPIRPKNIPKDKLDELNLFLATQYRRAKDARSTQLEQKYEQWDKLYDGTPREKTRTIPFYKSSNFVVKLIRIYIDTFIARTLNIIFATRPLFTLDGYPRDLREAGEAYLNRKARFQWQMYNLAREMMNRGTKNGTAVCKTVYQEKNTIVASAGADGSPSFNPFVSYSGPCNRVIPFEDFFAYPYTANRMEDVEIKFHRVRYTALDALRRFHNEDIAWRFDNEEEVERACEQPNDPKREKQQQEAGVYDPHTRELQLIECHLDYPLSNDPSKYYSLVVLRSEVLNKIIDLYYNPTPGNAEIFHAYRPCPKEDFFFGDSWCEVLEQGQEEASQIHNDRRNDAMLRTGPQFKKKSSALVPNPSTNSYPGKVHEVDEMDDFEVLQLGQTSLGDTIQEENVTVGLMGSLIGIADASSGMSQGQSGKRGTYNTGGVMAIMAEGNQRQDTNIRDVRFVLGEIGKINLLLQASFGADDPSIASFPQEMQGKMHDFLRSSTYQQIANTQLEVNVSHAGANKEVEKASLMQMAQVLASHGQAILSLAPSLVNQQMNPALLALQRSVIEMSAWMARRLLNAYDVYDSSEILPDLDVILSGGGQQPAAPGMAPAGAAGMGSGGATGPAGPIDGATLQALASMGAGSRAGSGAGLGIQGPQ